MNIKFKGHSVTDREVEISQKELFQLFEMMREEFINHITYGKFDGLYPTRSEKIIANFCKSFDVDVEYEKDRVAFFSAILDNMKNPYQQ